MTVLAPPAPKTTFIPQRVFFEPAALDYHLGRQWKANFQDSGIPVQMTSSHNRVTGLPGQTPQEKYRAAKETLVVGIKKGLDFPTCKPSAHYQLPLATSCPGMCQYCYLATTLGPRPYVRVYANLEEILGKAYELMIQRAPEITVFEGAATSDPLPVEPYTGSLAKTISFFADSNLGRFRFVTKFTEVEPLLDLTHRGHTTVRFSLNTARVISTLEQKTPPLYERLKAAQKVGAAGYPIGVLIAPIFADENWREEYGELLQEIANTLIHFPLTFELITHRYTKRAKNQIRSVFPNTPLEMEETERKPKYGQFGYIKYLYQPDTMAELEDFFRQEITRLFPHSEINYFV